MNQVIGTYRLKEQSYADASVGAVSYSDAFCSLWIFGRVLTENAVNDGAEISNLYQQHGTALTQHLNGVYKLILFEKGSRILRVFQDRATSGVALYYTQNGDCVHLCTSLKTLLRQSRIPRAMNENAVEEFIVNGFLYGRHTLVQNVYKIEAYHCLEIADGEIWQRSVHYPLKEMTKGEALDRFKPTLDAAIRAAASDLDAVSFPLSSGYDSNYIAQIVTETAATPVTGFSIGGKRGRNELPIVEKNVQYYRNLTLQSAVTDEDSLRSFPDIVWRLEGNVWESGLFLQYELMRLVKACGRHTLICGECADQVMNLYYLNEDRIHPKQNDAAPRYYEFSEYPYIFSSYLILKKNGILANSFDIETRYPYLDEDLISVCGALGAISRKDKRVHVANCLACLPPEVTANMSKIGGTTDCHSLFGSQKEIQAFFDRVEQSAFFAAHRDLIQKHAAENKEKQTGLTLVKTKLRNFLLSLLNSRNADAYLFEELKLREYLCVAYLSLFQQLLLSGDYDLSAEACDLTFDAAFH